MHPWDREAAAGPLEVPDPEADRPRTIVNLEHVDPYDFGRGDVGALRRDLGRAVGSQPTGTQAAPRCGAGCCRRCRTATPARRDDALARLLRGNARAGGRMAIRRCAPSGRRRARSRLAATPGPVRPGAGLGLEMDEKGTAAPCRARRARSVHRGGLVGLDLAPGQLLVAVLSSNPGKLERASVAGPTAPRPGSDPPTAAPCPPRTGPATRRHARSAPPPLRSPARRPPRRGPSRCAARTRPPALCARPGRRGRRPARSSGGGRAARRLFRCPAGAAGTRARVVEAAPRKPQGLDRALVGPPAAEPRGEGPRIADADLERADRSPPGSATHTFSSPSTPSWPHRAGGRLRQRRPRSPPAGPWPDRTASVPAPHGHALGRGRAAPIDGTELRGTRGGWARRRLRAGRPQPLPQGAGERAMPVHVHADEEELFYVVAGDGVSWQDGRVHRSARATSSCTARAPSRTRSSGRATASTCSPSAAAPPRA